MKTEELYLEIKKFCEKNVNEGNIKKYSRYFKEGYDSYGLSQAHMDELTNKVLENKSIDVNLILELSKLLVTSGKYEETNLAVRYIRHFSKQYNKLVFETIEKWFDLGINNWANCDVVCGELISEFLLKDIISYYDLGKWKTAKNKYQRRAVPVSFIKIIKSKGGHKEFLSFIDSMMMDKEKVVHQGLGWFLREAWKLNKETTESFLFKWKDKAPRLIFQYATEKMSKEEKVRFKKNAD